MNNQADPLEMTEADRSRLVGETMRWALWIGASAEVLVLGYIFTHWWSGRIWPEIWWFLAVGPIVAVSAFIHIRTHRLERVSDAAVRRQLAESDRRSRERLKKLRGGGGQLPFHTVFALQNPAQLALAKTILVGAMVATAIWLIMAWLTGGGWLIEQILALILFGHYLYKLTWRFGRQRKTVAAGLCGGLLLGWVSAVVFTI